jgi:hypothetical protein
LSFPRKVDFAAMPQIRRHVKMIDLDKLPWFREYFRVITALILIILTVGCHKKRTTASSTFTSTTPHANANMPPKRLKVEKSDFLANLSAANETINPAETTANGQALFKISRDSSQIYYTVDLTPANSGVTVVQLRYGSLRKKGTFIARLFPQLRNSHPSAKDRSANAALTSGMLNNKDLGGHFMGKKMISLVHAIKDDSVFVQVDTKTHPQGEIRGLLKPNKH